MVDAVRRASNMGHSVSATDSKAEKQIPFGNDKQRE
jgi:hypothetical protein